MKREKLLNIGDAVILSASTGQPFRHILMRPMTENHPEVWFEYQSEGKILVIGPDDVVPFDEAIPMQWRKGKVWEVRTPKSHGRGASSEKTNRQTTLETMWNTANAFLSSHGRDGYGHDCYR